MVLAFPSLWRGCMCACKAPWWLDKYQSLEVGDWAVFGWFCMICSLYSNQGCAMTPSEQFCTVITAQWTVRTVRASKWRCLRNDGVDRPSRRSRGSSTVITVWTHRQVLFCCEKLRPGFESWSRHKVTSLMPLGGIWAEAWKKPETKPKRYQNKSREKG